MKKILPWIVQSLTKHLTPQQQQDVAAQIQARYVQPAAQALADEVDRRAFEAVAEQMLSPEQRRARKAVAKLQAAVGQGPYDPSAAYSQAYQSQLANIQGNIGGTTGAYQAQLGQGQQRGMPNTATYQMQLGQAQQALANSQAAQAAIKGAYDAQAQYHALLSNSNAPQAQYERDLINTHYTELQKEAEARGVQGSAKYYRAALSQFVAERDGQAQAAQQYARQAATEMNRLQRDAKRYNILTDSTV
jgi:hypothetical protein